jgi:hypothetical protein
VEEVIQLTEMAQEKQEGAVERGDNTWECKGMTWVSPPEESPQMALRAL